MIELPDWLLDTQVALFDTETSNMDDTCRLVEVGLIRGPLRAFHEPLVADELGFVDTKQWQKHLKKHKVTEWSTLINPDGDFVMGPDAMAAHGLRPVDLVEAPGTEVALRSLCPMLEDTIAIAHNGSFDWRVLAREMIQTFAEPASMGWPAKMLDTWRLARQIVPDQPSFKLQGLYHLWNLPRIQAGVAHRALDDCRTLGFVLVRMIQEAMAEGYVPESIEGMIKFSREPLPISIVKFGKHKGQLLRHQFAGAADKLVPSDWLEWWCLKRQDVGEPGEDWDTTYCFAKELLLRHKRDGRKVPERLIQVGQRAAREILEQQDKIDLGPRGVTVI